MVYTVVIALKSFVKSSWFDFSSTEGSVLFKSASGQATTNMHCCYTSFNTSCLVFVPYDHSHKYTHTHIHTLHTCCYWVVLANRLIDRSRVLLFNDQRANSEMLTLTCVRKGYTIRHIIMWLCTVLSDLTLYSTVVTFIAYPLIY